MTMDVLDLIYVEERVRIWEPSGEELLEEVSRAQLKTVISLMLAEGEDREDQEDFLEVNSVHLIFHREDSPILQVLHLPMILVYLI